MELIAEFMYKTFQRESKWRTKKIFMRNCQYQRNLFLYWAIALPQNCYFDIYIYIYIYIYTQNTWVLNVLPKQFALSMERFSTRKDSR